MTMTEQEALTALSTLCLGFMHFLLSTVGHESAHGTSIGDGCADQRCVCSCSRARKEAEMHVFQHVHFIRVAAP